MDKQINLSQIPVNTRTIGTPGGIYILYLEDYVHTFMKKFATVHYEKAPSPAEIALFGRRYEEEGSSVFVVSGAAQQPFPEDKGMQYFPSCAFLGSAKVGLNKDAGLRLEIALKNTSVILDDFYIYYDQNEEMQNYLIEWNSNSRASGRQAEGDYVEGSPLSGSYEERGTEGVRPERRGAQVRAETDEAVRYGRIAQAYNRGEAKVSFIWNVMSALCLGFVVCVMAYGIISVNNYHKMKSMQDTIDYCLALVTESLKQNEAVLTNATAIATAMNGEDKQQADQVSGQMDAAGETDSEMGLTTESSAVLAERQTTQTDANLDNIQPANHAAAETVGQDMLAQSEGNNEQNGESFGQAAGNAGQDSGASGQTTQTAGQNEGAVKLDTQTTEQAGEIVEDETAADETFTGTEETKDALESVDSQQITETVSTPQYYVVRRGDTLRSICFQVYGDYSKVDEICEWNKIEDPNNILYGQRLLLP